MILYIYSSQDLIINNRESEQIVAGNFYCLKIQDGENILIYPTSSAGVIILNKQIIAQCNHNNIIFHTIDKSTVLCEIKPFEIGENIHSYKVDQAEVRLVYNRSNIIIYFKSQYYGIVNGCYNRITFKKLGDLNPIGILYLDGYKKNIIVFNKSEIIFCGEYIDIESCEKFIQIYTHNSNVFNIGTLLKYSADNKLEIKNIQDFGPEIKQLNPEFNLIYFIEAIKCGRFKYAYNKMSYDLKSEITIETLKEYFVPFDRYIYLSDKNIYVTIKNSKIQKIYRFEIKDNLINNIY